MICLAPSYYLGINPRSLKKMNTKQYVLVIMTCNKTIERYSLHIFSSVIPGIDRVSQN